MRPPSRDHPMRGEKVKANAQRLTCPKRALGCVVLATASAQRVSGHTHAHTYSCAVCAALADNREAFDAFERARLALPQATSCEPAGGQQTGRAVEEAAHAGLRAPRQPRLLRHGGTAWLSCRSRQEIVPGH